MELSCKVFHINAGIQQQFVLKLSIVRNLNQFNILLELYSLNVQDETTLNIVLDHVSKFPNDGTLLKKIDNKLIDSIHLNYYEIESYLPVFKTDLTNVINNIRHPEELFTFRICNKFDVIFNLLQLKRLYSDLYGFYQNYMVLDALYKLTLKNTVESTPKTEKIAQYKNVLKEENKKELNPPILKPVYTEENTKFDNLLTLCVNQTMKSFIINLTCNYYVYISDVNCFIDKENDDNLIKIQACSLYPTSYIFNSDYIKSLIMSLISYNQNEIDMRLKKLFNCLISDDNTPVERMSVLGMIYVYYLVYLYQTHTSYLLKNIVSLFCDVTIQSRLFNNHTKLYLKRNDVVLFLKELTIQQMDEKDQNFDIVGLGKKYDYLINVSEDSFIEKILEDLNTKNENKSVILNSKRIININNLKSLQSAEAKKIDFIKSNNLLDTDNQLDYDELYVNIFSYDFNNPYLTLANQYFTEFINNQSNFLLDYKQNKINIKLVPVNVINLFDIVKQILYDRKSGIHKSINTFTYYKILVSKINDPSVFPHSTYLFIIYQLFIPFMYLNYGIIEFESTF